MKAQFPVEAEQIVTTRGGATLQIPGGICVPPEYNYVETGDYLIEKCEAAWSTEGGDGLPLDFRLVGPPGVGKNAVVYALAKRRRRPLYIVQGHEDMTAEDLVVSATLGSGGEVKYVASPLLAAMLTGGICFIDEIAKMRPRALAPLASVLDQRRTISSALLGETFAAHPEFRFCAAYNPTDADAFDLAPWLKRRTLPELEVSLPDIVRLEQIVKLHTGSNTDQWTKVENYLRRHRYSGPQIDVGTAVRLMTYIHRLESLKHTMSASNDEIIRIAIKHVLCVGLGNEKG